MNKNLIAPVGLLLAGLILAGSVSAFHLPLWGSTGGPGMSAAQTSLNTALLNNDYDAYMAARAEQWPNAPTITKEEFAVMAAKYKTHADLQAAIDQGDYSHYTTLMKENFPERSVLTQEQFDAMVAQQATEKKIQDAISSGDYTAWKNAMNERAQQMANAMTAGITAENFHLLNDIQVARAAGDMTKVKDLESQLGTVFPRMENGFGEMHNGMNGEMGSGMMHGRPFNSRRTISNASPLK